MKTSQQLKDKINGLTHEFVTLARAHGIEVHGISVEWRNGKFVANVQYLHHKIHIPVDTPLDEGTQFLETA